ncbi:hypothetical protein HK102_011453, partial [Quaeritorhiza haematococci]
MRQLNHPWNTYAYNLYIYTLTHRSSSSSSSNTRFSFAIANSILTEMHTNNTKPDSITYGTLIDGLVRRGQVLGAMGIWNRMKADVEEDARRGRRVFGREGEGEGEERRLEHDPVVCNILVLGLVKQGRLDDAEAVLEEFVEIFASTSTSRRMNMNKGGMGMMNEGKRKLKRKGLGALPFTSLITALIAENQGERAWRWVAQMMDNSLDLQLTAVDVNQILTAYQNACSPSPSPSPSHPSPPPTFFEDSDTLRSNTQIDESTENESRYIHDMLATVEMMNKAGITPDAAT